MWRKKKQKKTRLKLYHIANLNLILPARQLLSYYAPLAHSFLSNSRNATDYGKFHPDSDCIDLDDNLFAVCDYAEDDFLYASAAYLSPVGNKEYQIWFSFNCSTRGRMGAFFERSFQCRGCPKMHRIRFSPLGAAVAEITQMGLRKAIFAARKNKNHFLDLLLCLLSGSIPSRSRIRLSAL